VTCLLHPAKTTTNKTAGLSKSNNNNNNNNNNNTRRRQQTNRVKRTNNPTFNSTPNGIRVKHREYLSSVSIANAGFEVWQNGASTEGTFHVLPINPADGAFTPWLSGIASSYEYYEFNSLKVVYSPSVSSFTSGAILLSPEFDPHNGRQQPPTILSEFLNKQHAVTGNVWSTVTLSIPRNKMTKKLLRPEHSISVSTEHLRQTDAGQVYVALYNVESTQSIPYGEIFIEYDVSLTIPNQTRNTVKYYREHTQDILHSKIGLNRGALLGNDGDQNHVDGTSFAGSGTLGLEHEFINNPGLFQSGPISCDRYTFKEPFRGQLTICCNGHGGDMATEALPKYDGIAYHDEYIPSGIADIGEVHSISTGPITGLASKMNSVYNVIAKAGDVMDWFWDETGDFTFDDILMVVTEVGELLPLLL